jgi:hypothetical protein
MHSVIEIEEKIRQRYRHPKGVEQFGIEPVPPELKTVTAMPPTSIDPGLSANPKIIAKMSCHRFARCQMGAVVSAHDCFDLLDRNAAFVGGCQRHLCRPASCGRDHRL